MRRRAEEDHVQRMSLAWHTAVLGRVATIPPLSDITGVRPQIKKQTPAEVRALFAAWRESA